jgi:hypothetical protein
MMLVTNDRLWEWLEEKASEGVLVELYKNANSKSFVIQMKHLTTLQPMKMFLATTLLLAVKAA